MSFDDYCYYYFAIVVGNYLVDLMRQNSGQIDYNSYFGNSVSDLRLYFVLVFASLILINYLGLYFETYSGNSGSNSGYATSNNSSTRDAKACKYAQNENSLEAWQDYLDSFPDGECSFEAKGNIRKLQKEREKQEQAARYLKGRKIGNLIWSDRSSNEMNWSSAKQYCEDLSEGGFDDWRLPNIDELRTLLIADRVSSRCKVSERNNCLSFEGCWSCSTCTQTGIEDSNSKYKLCSDWGKTYTDGRYSRLGDGKVWLWSSSTLSDYPDRACYVHFSRGDVGVNRKSYDIYVRGNVDGDQWVGPLTATTIQSPAPLPLITGFEDEADNALWTLYNVRTVQGAFYPNFFIVGDAAKCEGTDENALFITNDSVNWMSYGNKTNVPGQEVATSSVWAVRNINIAETGTYRFRFRLKQPGNAYDNDGAYVQLIPAGATFKASTATLLSGETRNGNATTNANGCYTVMGKTRGITDWTWVNTNLDIEEAGIYTLAIYWYNSSSADAANLPYALPLAVDSVIVEEYLCTTPKNFEFVERKANTATISWFGGKCKNFEYVVSKYANLGMPNLIDAEDKIAAGTLTDGPQVTITDLLPNTAYSLYVRTICPDGETDWVEYDFETPCALEELPYTESFSETPECWILKSASATTANYKTPEMETAEKWTCLQLNNGGLAILPELAVELKNVEVELALFNSTSLGAVQLGVMDNTWDASTFQEIAFFQTVNKLGSSTSANPYVLETFSKMLNLYQGTGKVLAIKNATSNAVYVKYVKLTELPDCVKPQQVELTFIKDNEVTVNWLAGLEEAWEIKLNDSIIENVTTNPYRVTDLKQGTVYTVAVRALCDAETKSEWSQSTTFQTTCGVNPLPMFEDFSSLAKPAGSTDLKKAILTCWDNMVSTNNIDYVFSGRETPFTPASNVYVGDSWVSNWISALGDYAQLHSYRRDEPKYRHKWFISPQ